MAIYKTDALKKYLDYIFDTFAKEGLGVGKGGFYTTTWTYDNNTDYSFKNTLAKVVRVLEQNEMIHFDSCQSGFQFIKLTQRGYDYTQGGDFYLDKFDLQEVIDLTKKREEVYEELWNLIGVDGEAPFYLAGPDYFNTIAPFVRKNSYSYTQYIQHLKNEGKNQSRTVWYRELFYEIDEDDLLDFIDELNKTIINIYQPLFNTEPEEDFNPWAEEEISIEKETVASSNQHIIDNSMSKPNKIFISHSSKDEEIVKKLVLLLEFLGINGSNYIFCSSLSGYGVKVGENIYDRIKREYDTNNLFMIYMLSNDYLDSKISLNEMGAAWIMRNDYQVFLLNPVEINALDKVCIRKDNIVIAWNDEKAKTLLNDLKDKLVELFGLNNPETNIWEDRRDDFLKDFKNYRSAQPKEYENQQAVAHKTHLPKVQIVGSSEYNGRGSAEIAFYNNGTGIAHNLNIIIEECDGFVYRDSGIFPFEFLKPNHDIKLRAALDASFNGKIKAHIEWEEEGEKFSDVELIQVC